MDLPTVQARLADLPATFRQGGAAYQQMQTSLSLALLRHTANDDRLSSVISDVNQATGNWLDLWLRIFGFRRNADEADAAYRTRVLGVIRIGAGPPLAISSFVMQSFGLVAPVAEGDGSWSLEIPQVITSSQIAGIISDIGRVRPAGVPFSIGTRKGGLYLSTINFFRRPRLSGAYLVPFVQQVTLDHSSGTNAARPTVPTVYLTDPLLNA